MENNAIQSKTDTSVRQANDLLFASLFLEMNKVLKTKQSLNSRPELGGNISEVLSRMMTEEMPRFKDSKTPEEVKEAAVERVNEWKKAIGQPSIEQYAALSKYWGIPFSDVVNDKVTPSMIYDLLDCFVVGQEDYKRQLATSFFSYLLKNDERSGLLELPKSNLCVYGPSGSGKTFGFQTLARHYGIPIIIVRCNTLVPEGIRGISISDYFTKAYRSIKLSDKEKKKAELRKAIVCFDEFDKIFENEYYSESICNEILSCIDDDGEICFSEKPDHEGEKITLSNKNMMFVFTGVFQGLDKIRSGNCLGFRNGEKSGEALKRIDSKDLVKFGIKSEIAGRIQNCAEVKPLSVNDLYDLLNSNLESPFDTFRNYFRLNDIEAVITDEAKMMLAQMAYDRELGVRGIKGLLNTILREDMHHLNVGEKLEINCEYIEQHIN